MSETPASELEGRIMIDVFDSRLDAEDIDFDHLFLILQSEAAHAIEQKGHAAVNEYALHVPESPEERKSLFSRLARLIFRTWKKYGPVEESNELAIALTKAWFEILPPVESEFFPQALRNRMSYDIKTMDIKLKGGALEAQGAIFRHLVTSKNPEATMRQLSRLIDPVHVPGQPPNELQDLPSEQWFDVVGRRITRLMVETDKFEYMKQIREFDAKIRGLLQTPESIALYERFYEVVNRRAAEYAPIAHASIDHHATEDHCRLRNVWGVLRDLASTLELGAPQPTAHPNFLANFESVIALWENNTWEQVLELLPQLSGVRE